MPRISLLRADMCSPRRAEAWPYVAAAACAVRGGKRLCGSQRQGLKKGVVRMIEIKGRFNTAKCYASVLEEQAAAQIRLVCDQETFAGSRIRIMPDVHAGMGCTIGTTMTITDKVVPGMVGVDIGCGMETVVLAERDIDFEALDRLIRTEIPSGQNIREVPHPYQDEVNLRELCCYDRINTFRAERSIGTLGGGNHFIEVDRDEEGTLYLVVHSGSRHLGTQVANFYQDEGWRLLCGCGQRHCKAQCQFTYQLFQGSTPFLFVFGTYAEASACCTFV